MVPPARHQNPAAHGPSPDPRKRDRLRIGIVAHFVGVREGGNERYCENLIRRLDAMAAWQDEYYVFSYQGAAAARLSNGRLRHLPLGRRSVSWQRAIEIPRYARSLALDVL